MTGMSGPGAATRPIIATGGSSRSKEQESLLAKIVDQEKTWTEVAGHLPGHTVQLLKEIFKEESRGSGIESLV